MQKSPSEFFGELSESHKIRYESGIDEGKRQGKIDGALIERDRVLLEIDIVGLNFKSPGDLHYGLGFQQAVKMIRDAVKGPDAQ
jgi:hypothetical protein